MADDSKVVSIPSLDVQKYLGLWYEIGRLPLLWEPDNATDVTAHYAPNDDGTIQVDNRCFDDKGKPTQSVGRAKQDGDKTSELEVTFLPEFLRWIPFTEGKYWVLRIDDAYQHALVGSPDAKNLWLIARHHTVEPAIEQSFLETAKQMGFDLSKWIKTPQDGRRVTDDLLAKD